MGAKDQGADATAGRWLVIPRTLCFITHGDDVLLLKRGQHKRIFPGRYNGVGGHIERDEDPLTSAIREMQEETGLDVTNVQLRGVINVDADPGAANGIMVFVYSAEALSRDFTDSEEGTLEWIPRDDVEDLPLVEDLPVLLPLVFDSLSPVFFAHSSYDANDEQIMLFAANLHFRPNSD
jgi:8-oxo-dGTP diphosphatase